MSVQKSSYETQLLTFKTTVYYYVTYSHETQDIKILLKKTRQGMFAILQFVVTIVDLHYIFVFQCLDMA